MHLVEHRMSDYALKSQNMRPYIRKWLILLRKLKAMSIMATNGAKIAGSGQEKGGKYLQANWLHHHSINYL